MRALKLRCVDSSHCGAIAASEMHTWYYRRMIIDGEPIALDQSSASSRAIHAFLSFLERSLRVSIVRDRRTLAYGRGDLAELFALAQTFKERGVLESLVRATILPDEPRMRRWLAVCNDGPKHPASGATPDNDYQALIATLGETLERYLWTEANDHFVSPVRATVAEIAQHGRAIDPARFAGIAQDDRDARPALTLRHDARYLWVQAYSLTADGPVYVPAQTVTGAAVRRFENETEPLIRQSITTGVAVWPGKTQARLSGVLEIIERDAYMITWLNQIAPSRFSIESFKVGATPLAKLIERCERMHFKVHALQLLTDAPSHAVCVVVEDMSGHAPRFGFGLKAHRHIATALEGALIEALRGRTFHRVYAQAGNTWNPETPLTDIGHVDRINYWAVPEHAEKLAFFVRGPEIALPQAAWETDDAAAHLERVVAWCRTQGYECASVSIGTSALNPTSWDVESVVIPELQPTYLSEQMRQTGGTRLRSVPEHLGYTPRKHPYIDAPHPYA